MDRIISCCQSPWYALITVEPVVFLYRFAIELTEVVQQDLFIKKSCYVKHNYTESICENLKEFPDIYMRIQVRHIVF